MRRVEGVAERGVRGFDGKTRLKCLMSFGQVTANIGFTCSVTFPPIFEKIMNVFAVLNMDLLPALGLACRKSIFTLLMHTWIPLTSYMGITTDRYKQYFICLVPGRLRWIRLYE